MTGRDVMARLSNAASQYLPPEVARPDYSRAALTTGIVHLGVGAFHRAHMATYIDSCLAAQPDWGICGVSLRSPSTRDALQPQDGLYTLAVQASEGPRQRVIGAIHDLIVAPEEPARLASLLEAPTTKIVSLTVTEKGYCHDPASGRLNLSHPEIEHDLASDAFPHSAVGWLAYGVLARHAAGVAPFVILSCDNLPSNGKTLRTVLLDFIAHKAPDVLDWARETIACPSTMVDRIVPATTEADRQLVRDALGLEDHWPVISEPFSQFVVEDKFTLGRPNWERHGVTMTHDVEPFERMKLRMLNGSHSTLAYMGYLSGHQTVADTMEDPALKRLIADMMTQEIMPTLRMPPDIDLHAYRDALLARFSNTALKHRTWQIAMDGSQKLPQRLLDTVRERIASGLGFDRLALGVAAWMRYTTGTDEDGDPIDVRDPMSDRLAAIAASGGGNSDDLVTGFLGLDVVFGTDLPSNNAFRRSVSGHLQSLFAHGARATIAGAAGKG